MFSLAKKNTFKTKVHIPVPGQKDGIVEFEFNYMDRDQIVNFQASLTGRDDDESLIEIVIGWNGVDEDFSPESFSKLLKNYPGAAGAIWGKYLDEVRFAKTKN